MYFLTSSPGNHGRYVPMYRVRLRMRILQREAKSAFHNWRFPVSVGSIAANAGISNRIARSHRICISRDICKITYFLELENKIINCVLTFFYMYL